MSKWPLPSIRCPVSGIGGNKRPLRGDACRPSVKAGRDGGAGRCAAMKEHSTSESSLLTIIGEDNKALK